MTKGVWGGRWRTTARPPPLTPHSPPPIRRPRGRRPSVPPKAEGTVPPPPGRTAAPRGGGAAGPASTPPAACSRRNRDGQAKLRQPAPGDSKRAQTGAVCGPRPPWPARRQIHPLCCLPREGRETDRGKATPRPNAPPGRTTEENGAQAALHPTHPGVGTPQTRRPTPRGAHSPKRGRGETGPGCPSPKQAKRSTGPR